jgi:hypothetical protein
MEKISFTDVFYERTMSHETSFKLGFVPYDGYYPLLRLPTNYRAKDNMYFEGVHKGWIKSTISGLLYPVGGGNYIRYKGRGHRIPMAIYTGYLSAMGLNSSVSILPSHILDLEEMQRVISGKVDIFFLAVSKMNDLPNIISYNNSGYGSRKHQSVEIEINSKSVKILISTEKLKKTAFTNSNYTATVRKAIYRSLNDMVYRYNLKVEEVSEEYIEKFIQQSDTVSTNSIVEIMQMDNRIKENVFTNLNKAVV